MGVASLELLEIDVDDTPAFFNRIRDGIQGGPGDPCLTLSHRVANDLQAGASRRITWNALCEHESLVKLQVGRLHADTNG